MKHKLLIATLLALFSMNAFTAKSVYKPWSNGKLKVSANNLYIIHENGTPFFWMGNTAWLLPERLNREEAEYFLTVRRDTTWNRFRCSMPFPHLMYMGNRQTTWSLTSAK